MVMRSSTTWNGITPKPCSNHPRPWLDLWIYSLGLAQKLKHTLARQSQIRSSGFGFFEPCLLLYAFLKAHRKPHNQKLFCWCVWQDGFRTVDVCPHFFPAATWLLLAKERQTWMAGHLCLQVDFFLSIVDGDMSSRQYGQSHNQDIIVPSSNQGLPELL
jgi:hypothetical protein